MASKIETMDDGYGGVGVANIPAWGHEIRFLHCLVLGRNSKDAAKLSA
jgi:hypothetical protein